MIPGDTVTFSQRYLQGWHIRRRKVRGTVKQIIDNTVFIEIERNGTPQYSGLVGMPMSKVKVEGRYGK
jgi:hypothetical protein